MCGISGIVSHELSVQARESRIQIMNSSIKHRGPDDATFRSVSQDCSLGMVRLKVIDFEGGQQPFFTNCKQSSSLHLIFNGEIYNHNELRGNLISRGHAFKTTNSDTEVILHAYEEWGTDSFAKLNGMFAFAIFDKLQDLLIIVRDRFGEKPLYYQYENEIFQFCSEMKGLNKIAEIDFDLDEYSIFEYLSLGFIGSPRTAVDGIKKLPASHFLTLSKDMKLTVDSYFTFDFVEQSSVAAEYQIEFDRLLKKSVKDRMIADVPVGVFLSGGLDSSTIAYHAKTINPDILSFSIGFIEDDFNESEDAQIVANFLGLDHKSRIVTQKDAIDFLAILPNVLDEPMADVSIIPTYYLSQLARGHVTVALGGDGSDEFAYGYEVFNILKKLERYKHLNPIMSGLTDFGDFFQLKSNILKRAKKAKMLMDISNLQIRTNLLTGYNYPYMNRLLEEGVFELFADRFFENPSTGYDLKPEKQWVLGYMNGYLSEDILVKVDRASMASSLEVRSPFLDHDLVNFLIRVPMKDNHSKGVGKQLLRKSMVGKLPDHTLRKKKQGFGIPVDLWFSGEFGSICKEIVMDSQMKVPGLSKNAILSLFEDHDYQYEHLKHGHMLWTLTTLHIWGQKWL